MHKTKDMKPFTWVKGRQSARYQKMLLFRFKLAKWEFDAYLLKYQPLTILPTHLDEVSGGKHYRMNISIFGESKFSCEKQIYQSKRINIFRPDLYQHSLKVFTKTLKLSLGKVLVD